MKKDLKKIIDGYKNFRTQYTSSKQTIMQHLSYHGQSPNIAVLSCCDSRVDPSIIFQCEPGDLFVIRNIGAIVPPYEKDNKHHGTSAAMEYAIRHLNISNLILFGHSQCGGMESLFDNDSENDFITNWVSILQLEFQEKHSADDYTKLALQKSYENCLSFPWIKERISTAALNIHIFFFDIATCQIFNYNDQNGIYEGIK